MDLNLLVKKVLVSIYKSVKRINVKLHYWAISTDPNIVISLTSRIDVSSKVQIKYGGSIVIGNNSEILEGVIIQTYGGIIKIGNNCSVNPYAIIYGHGNTTIGDNVLIAGGCMIVPSNHNFSDLDKNINEQGSTSMGIVIEDNVWIGHGCSILDNVIIGRGSVIAAGCVVNKNIPAHSVVAGVPAKIIASRK